MRGRGSFNWLARGVVKGVNFERLSSGQRRAGEKHLFLQIAIMEGIPRGRLCGLLIWEWARAIRPSSREATTSREITKPSVYLLAARDVFQNVSYAPSGQDSDGVTRIELCVIEIELR
jgi:hypothetical protein